MIEQIVKLMLLVDKLLSGLDMIEVHETLVNTGTAGIYVDKVCESQ